MTNRILILLCWILVLSLGGCTGLRDGRPRTEAHDYYTLTWSSPGRDETDNMPMGNGRFAANVWVVEDGDLMFYLAHQEAHSELQSLLKLGRLRVHLDPNPFAKGKPFRQTMNMRQGSIDIEAGDPAAPVRLTLLIDKEADVLYVTGTSARPVAATVTLENWRTQRRDTTAATSQWEPNKPNLYCRIGCPPGKTDYWESADVFPECSTGLLWYHRNAYSAVPVHIREQHLQGIANLVPDPLKDNTFGALVTGAGMVKKDALTLATEAPCRTIDLRVAALVQQTATAEEWLAGVERRSHDSVAPAVARQRTARWWNEFCERSWVIVDEGDAAAASVAPIPKNRYPLRFGADVQGGNALPAMLAGGVVYDRPLAAAEIARLANQKPTEPPAIPQGLLFAQAGGAAKPLLARQTLQTEGIATLAPGWLEAAPAPQLDGSLTCAGWFQLRPGTPNAARFFDKGQPGGIDGYSLMFYDQRLRLALGPREHVWSVPDRLILPGSWHHVALTLDARTGAATLYLDGQQASPAPSTSAPGAPSAITQRYLCSRIAQAMDAGSSFPVHFQGGLHTVDPIYTYWHGYRHTPADNLNPDYRYFGPGYWWQNTREMYWPCAAAGDYDQLPAFFDFFLSKTRLFEERARLYYGAKGVYVNECVAVFGLPGMAEFGWDSQDYSEPYTRTIQQQCLELAALMFEYYDHTQDRAFLREKLIPWATKSLEYYDTRFGRDEKGRLRITPTHAVETYWTDVVNDMPSVAGLHYVTRRLLALPENEAPAETRAYWQRVQAILPDLPKRTVDGQTMPDNAQSYKPARTNFEAPDLYSVHPFPIYGLGRTEHNIEEAREAWRHMPNPTLACWYQTGIFAARLGLAAEAARDVSARSAPNQTQRNAQTQKPVRYPGYMDTPHDYPPDFDAAAMQRLTLQAMLLQDGPNHEIFLFPAWPKEWDVDFKLHASANTTVKCRLKQGKIVELDVVPASRKQDVVILNQEIAP